MNGLVEKYYTAQEVAFLLGYSVAWVIEKAKASEFGAALFIADRESKGVRGRACTKGDWRIPASGVNAWIDRNKWQQSTVALPQPTAARTEGELRRKAA